MTTVLPPLASAEIVAEVHDAYGVDLLDLAHVRLEQLLFNPDSETVSTLDSVMKRLFDPRERDLLIVSAFSSAL